MTNYQEDTRRASAPALLAAFAIAPIMLSSCLSKSDRETIDVPVPVGDPAGPAETATSTPAEAKPAEEKPKPPPYSLLTAEHYVVQPGDTLSGIATEYGVSTNDIRVANKIENVNKIRTGQTLLVPPKSKPADEGAPTEPETPEGETETETEAEAEAAPETTDGTSGLKLPGLTTGE